MFVSICCIAKYLHEHHIQCNIADFCLLSICSLLNSYQFQSHAFHSKISTHFLVTSFIMFQVSFAVHISFIHRISGIFRLIHFYGIFKTLKEKCGIVFVLTRSTQKKQQCLIMHSFFDIISFKRATTFHKIAHLLVHSFYLF